MLHLADGSVKTFRMRDPYSRMVWLDTIQRSGVTLKATYFGDAGAADCALAPLQAQSLTPQGRLCKLETTNGRRLYLHYGETGSGVRLVALAPVPVGAVDSATLQQVQFVSYYYGGAACLQATAPNASLECDGSTLCCVGQGVQGQSLGVVSYHYEATSLGGKVPRLKLAEDSAGAISERHVWSSGSDDAKVVETEDPNGHVWLSYNDPACTLHSVPDVSPLVRVLAPSGSVTLRGVTYPATNGEVYFRDGQAVGQNDPVPLVDAPGTWVFDGSSQTLTCSTFDTMGYMQKKDGGCGCGQSYDVLFTPMPQVTLQADASSYLFRPPAASTRQVQSIIGADGKLKNLRFDSQGRLVQKKTRAALTDDFNPPADSESEVRGYAYQGSTTLVALETRGTVAGSAGSHFLQTAYDTAHLPRVASVVHHGMTQSVASPGPPRASTRWAGCRR
jgi:hypothetical protein